MKNQIFKLNLQAPASLIFTVIIVLMMTLNKDSKDVAQACPRSHEADCRIGNTQSHDRSCSAGIKKGR
jgi:hypothetical protein